MYNTNKEFVLRLMKNHFGYVQEVRRGILYSKDRSIEPVILSNDKVQELARDFQ